MKKQKYEVIGETKTDIVSVITTASTVEKRIKAFRKKYPNAEILQIVELAMYK